MPDGNQKIEKETISEDHPATEAAQTPASEKQPSLAERLMSLDPSRGTNGRPAPTTPSRKVDTPSAASTQPAADRPSSPQTERRAWNPPAARFSPAIVEDTLDEARRYIRFRYLVFLASILVVFLVALIVGVAFIASLLSGADWEQTGISGGVLAVSILLLVLLQYRPARSFALAASQLAQLEATQGHLTKSYGFWERYLVEHQKAHQLTANDVALAVSSLTAATRELMTAQLSLDGGVANQSDANGKRARGSRLPTGINPDPRRY